MVAPAEKRLLTLMVAPQKSLVVFVTPAGWVAQGALVDGGKMTPATKGELLGVPPTRLPMGGIVAAVRQETRKQK